MSRRRGYYHTRKRSQTYEDFDETYLSVVIFPRYFTNLVGWKDNSLYVRFREKNKAHVISQDSTEYPLEITLDDALDNVKWGFWQEIDVHEVTRLKQQAEKRLSKLTFPKYFIKIRGWSDPKTVYVRQDGYNTGVVVSITGDLQETTIPYEHIIEEIKKGKWKEINETLANRLLQEKTANYKLEKNYESSRTPPTEGGDC